MDEPSIQFPVTCPVCGREALLTRPLARIAGILLTCTDQLELTAPCHGKRWIASPDELDLIRECMGAPLPGDADGLSHLLRQIDHLQSALSYPSTGVKVRSSVKMRA